MKKFYLILFALLLSSSFAFAQGTAGGNAKYEYRNIIDLPSAGVLEKGYVGITTDILPKGVLISKIEVGVFQNFSFGISYGGSQIIGRGNPDWYKLPGINVRLRLVNESEQFPALSVGFDSQGKGVYFDRLDRYEIKSPGFYAAVSKNYQFLGYLSFHGILNYSLERDDNDKDVNFGIGLEKTIGPRISFVAEYDFAINDNSGKAIGEGNGYLNMGMRWSAGDGFTIGIDFRNLLSNQKFNSYKADRAIFVEYIKSIF
jgi:hypothetical protein